MAAVPAGARRGPGVDFVMARISEAALDRARRRAAILRADLAEGWREISGVDVSVEGEEVILEGRRLRLRALTDPALWGVVW